MRVGLVGTGAVAHKHAAAYLNMGFQVVACTDVDQQAGRDFAVRYGAEFVPAYPLVCSHPMVDYVDVCTPPGVRMEIVEECARVRKSVLVEKPIATNLTDARRMIALSRSAGIQLGVVSQHRFDDSILFVADAIKSGRMGRILQADAYVKWYRPPEYYSRPIKGSWKMEGGGALINQAIHQVDLLLLLAGPVRRVFGAWQLAALHKIESEDVVSAVMQYASGATGVIQASTAMWPGFPERIEIQGEKGTAIISADKLVTYDVQGDAGTTAPVSANPSSASSDPMAISLEPFERMFRDFAEAVRSGSKPSVHAEAGYRALELVTSIYRSCREMRPVEIDSTLVEGSNSRGLRAGRD